MRPTRSERPAAPRRRRPLQRRWSAAIRRLRESEGSLLLVLCLVGVLCGAAVSASPNVPASLILLPMVIGSLVLGPRYLPWLVIALLSVLLVAVGTSMETLDEVRMGGMAVDFIVGLIILLASFRRSRLGVAGARGESMLVDLRDRIRKQGELPRLPRDWYAEAVLRSAGGSSFAGDFMVAATSPDHAHLQVAVVDVSGKGVQAGTRSLLLSGAFGGLLGALPPAGFLPAANLYLLQQDWSEGFATAVHLSLDLQSGEFELRSAGHPPAVQLRAGSGRWVVHEVEGPVLGLLYGAEFPAVRGRLQRGDALLLYTDGLVETPSRDISLGIDRLTGQGERLLQGGFEDGARRLVDRLDTADDDRALLLIHRR